MKITTIGTDFISINENNINDKSLRDIPRVHLIKLDFKEPTEEKIQKVMEIWDKTNRFVVSDNIKLYNNFLKTTAKKYYICNRSGDKLLSFLRKNNKVLLIFNNLSQFDKSYIFSSPDILTDLLRNVEVIQISKSQFDMYRNQFEGWNGNVIIENV